MEKYLPLQYCLDSLQEPDDMVLDSDGELFKSLTNRDFGSYLYSFSNMTNAGISLDILKRSRKPRLAEEEMQKLEFSLLLIRWARTKQVYEPDAFFSKVLLSTDAIKVYPDLLRRIPFKDFYIDLSNNEYFKSDGIFVSVEVYDNDEIRILYMVADKETRKKFVDIIDFTPEMHPMKDLEESVELKGEHKQIFDMDRAIVKQRGGNLEEKRICTGKEYVPQPHNASYYKFDKSMCPKVYQGHNFTYMDISNIAPDDPISDITLFIIQFLLYLSSKEPNITESELTKHTYRPTKNPKFRFSEIRKWDVELYYGKRIKMFEEKQRRENLLIDFSEPKGGTHRSPRPHTRGAHWHSYWCGSGEYKHIEQRWLDVMYVNGTRGDIIAKNNEAVV